MEDLWVLSQQNINMDVAIFKKLQREAVLVGPWRRAGPLVWRGLRRGSQSPLRSLEGSRKGLWVGQHGMVWTQ